MQLTCEELKSLLRAAGVVPTTLHENRPSAGIGVVEVQKPMVFLRFLKFPRDLCGDRRGRGAKTRGFLRFLQCSRNPLRGSAWSRCKNSRFFCDLGLYFFRVAGQEGLSTGYDSQV